MRYLIRNKDGGTEEIPVKIVKHPDYRTYYADGASGGILDPYHYRIDFYRDEVPSLEGTIRESVIEEEKEVGKMELPEKVVTREVDLSVYLSLPFAKQLRDWLDRTVRGYEQKFGEIKVVGREEPIGTEEEPEETE